MNGNTDVLNAQNAQFIRTQLRRPARLTKKWNMTLIGLGCVGFVFIVSMVMLILRPSVAGQVASIGQFVVLGFSGMVAAFIGAQGVVDARSVSALSTDAPPST